MFAVNVSQLSYTFLDFGFILNQYAHDVFIQIFYDTFVRMLDLNVDPCESLSLFLFPFFFFIFPPL